MCPVYINQQAYICEVLYARLHVQDYSWFVFYATTQQIFRNNVVGDSTDI